MQLAGGALPVVNLPIAGRPKRTPDTATPQGRRSKASDPPPLPSATAIKAGVTDVGRPTGGRIPASRLDFTAFRNQLQPIPVQRMCEWQSMAAKPLVERAFLFDLNGKFAKIRAMQ
jgi:hypothetical protein